MFLPAIVTGLQCSRFRFTGNDTNLTAAITIIQHLYRQPSLSAIATPRRICHGCAEAPLVIPYNVPRRGVSHLRVPKVIQSNAAPNTRCAAVHVCVLGNLECGNLPTNVLLTKHAGPQACRFFERVPTVRCTVRGEAGGGRCTRGWWNIM